MKAKMGVGERINLMEILPREGNFATAVLVRGIGRKLELKPNEISAFGINQDDKGLIHWNPAIDSNRDLEFDDAECAFIADTLKKRSEANTLSVDLIDVYGKFVLKE